MFQLGNSELTNEHRILAIDMCSYKNSDPFTYTAWTHAKQKIRSCNKALGHLVVMQQH